MFLTPTHLGLRWEYFAFALRFVIFVVPDAHIILLFLSVKRGRWQVSGCLVSLFKPNFKGHLMIDRCSVILSIVLLGCVGV
jgi:hypothetical protein